jgi:hypothetical protein
MPRFSDMLGGDQPADDEHDATAEQPAPEPPSTGETPEAILDRLTQYAQRQRSGGTEAPPETETQSAPEPAPPPDTAAAPPPDTAAAPAPDVPAPDVPDERTESPVSLEALPPAVDDLLPRRKR